MADDFITGEDDDLDPLNPEHQAVAEQRARKRSEDSETEARAFLMRRQEAYQRVFKGSPMNGDLEIVLRDLRDFTRGETTAWHMDERVHALMTGRQEVWIRIMDHTRLPFDALYLKYNSR